MNNSEPMMKISGAPEFGDHKRLERGPVTRYMLAEARVLKLEEALREANAALSYVRAEVVDPEIYKMLIDISSDIDAALALAS